MIRGDHPVACRIGKERAAFQFLYITQPNKITVIGRRLLCLGEKVIVVVFAVLSWIVKV
jgi:hypothetical protein